MILDVPSPSLCDRRAGPLCGSGCVCFGSALLFHHETRGSSIDVFSSGGARPSPWDTFTPLHENELPFRCGRESRKSRFRREVELHNNNCPGWSGGREVNQDPRKGSLDAVPEQARRRVEITPGCHHRRTGAVGCGELSLILNNVLKSRTPNVTFSLFDCVHGIKI